MVRKKTHDEYIIDLYIKHGGEYVALEQYTGNKTLTMHKHTVCGYEWRTYPNAILRDLKCPKCSRLKSHEQYVQELDDTEYEVLEKYQGNNIKILHRHKICGHTWKARPHGIHELSYCPGCVDKGKSVRRTHEEYVRLLASSEYEILGQYINSNTPTPHRHKKCGHEWNPEPRWILSGHGCPVCAMTARTFTHEWYLSQMANTEYEPLEEYKLYDVKILHRHKICGHEWEVRPDQLLTGATGCPNCASSKGEKKIEQCLSTLGLKHKAQFKFQDCKNKIPLPFDFIVFLGNCVFFLIEFDGIQHFEPITHWGGEKHFRQRQVNDAKKTRYCRFKQIPLLRIPYYEVNNIEKIIIDFIYAFY